MTTTANAWITEHGHVSKKLNEAGDQISALQSRQDELVKDATAHADTYVKQHNHSLN